MRYPERNGPPRRKEAAQEKRTASGNSEIKHSTRPISDATLARYLGVRRSRVWQLIARGDIPRPNRDTGHALYWSGLMLRLLTRDIESGKAGLS